MRNSVFGISNQFILRLACSAVATSLNLEIYFACGKFRYFTFLKANNKGVDLTTRMRWLACAFVARKHPKIYFLALRSIKILAQDFA